VFKATQVLNNEASALFQKTVISIKCGAYHCIALNSDNSVAGWGRNDYGQVGVDYRYTAYYSDDNFYNMPPEPYQSFQHTPQLINRGKIGQKEIVLIECGSMASYAVTRDGTMYVVNLVDTNILATIGVSTASIN
jgi:alpha-tubulin suppressor-like RCC1 family protein